MESQRKFELQLSQRLASVEQESTERLTRVISKGTDKGQEEKPTENTARIFSTLRKAKKYVFGSLNAAQIWKNSTFAFMVLCVSHISM